MTRQSQSCEAMRAKCSRQSEQQMQGLKPGMNLVYEVKGGKPVRLKHWEAEMMAPKEL